MIRSDFLKRHAKFVDGFCPKVKFNASDAGNRKRNGMDRSPHFGEKRKAGGGSQEGDG
jgi:hypothetical protein